MIIPSNSFVVIYNGQMVKEYRHGKTQIHVTLVGNSVETRLREYITDYIPTSSCINFL